MCNSNNIQLMFVIFLVRKKVWFGYDNNKFTGHITWVGHTVVYKIKSYVELKFGGEKQDEITPKNN